MDGVCKQILSINVGSTSVKYKLYTFDLSLLCTIHSLVLSDRIEISYTRELDGLCIKKELLSNYNIDTIIDEVVNLIYEPQSGVLSKGDEIDIIANRFLHGGKYTHTVKIEENFIQYMQTLLPLGRAHIQSQLDYLTALTSRFKNALFFASFDTSFHDGLDKTVAMYPLPRDWFTDYGVRRYGYHGLSYQGAHECLTEYFASDRYKSIICHLGGGSSVCAIQNGRTVDFSMGFSTLDGPMMGTRCGLIDPMIIPYMAEKLNLSYEEIIKKLHTESGFKALLGHNDLRKAEKQFLEGDQAAILAIEMYTTQIAKYISSFIPVLGSLDALVFTGGIGYGSSVIRAKIIEKLSYFKFELDDNANNKAHSEQLFVISSNQSTPILIIKADEEKVLAKEALSALKRID